MKKIEEKDLERLELTTSYNKLNNLYLAEISEVASKCISIIEKFKIEQKNQQKIEILNEFLFAYDCLTTIVKVLNDRYLEEEAKKFWQIAKSKTDEYLEARRIWMNIFFNLDDRKRKN